MEKRTVGQAKRLKLSRETLKVLSNDELRRIAAAGMPSNPADPQCRGVSDPGDPEAACTGGGGKENP